MVNPRTAALTAAPLRGLPQVLVDELTEVVVIANGVRAGRAKQLAIAAIDRLATRCPTVAGIPIALST